MNTNQLKKFAQAARRKLLEQVGAKLEFVLTQDTTELREQAAALKSLKAELERIGKDQLIDKVAYTWFNRLVALRFMDLNDYQPSGSRIVSPVEGASTPQILAEAKQAHFDASIPVNQQQVLDLLDGRIPSNNAENEAYRLLLVAGCNALHKQFPFLFERINDYAALLLPDDLTSTFSVLQDIRAGMTKESCQEVEVIGWLYQFYISERKDEVFAAKGKVAKKDIPAATQLFTPRWIVEYMVQNTLGKLWLQNKPDSSLRDYMPYFIESPSMEATDYLQVDGVEEITLLDQACGSGHILVYAFELFTKIYEEEGYSSSEIPYLILKHNLHGFEIDERAAQLASFTLMMKARQYYRRFFKKESQANIFCFQDLPIRAYQKGEEQDTIRVKKNGALHKKLLSYKYVSADNAQQNTPDEVAFFDDDIRNTFRSLNLPLSDELYQDLVWMKQATNFGSLIQPKSSIEELTTALKALEDVVNTADVFLKNKVEALIVATQQLIRLARQYHCVVDNPPYMGGGKMNKVLSSWVKINYPKSKADLMVCFMERAQSQLYKNGYVGMINLPSWMFLSSFKDYRKELIKEYQIDTLLHLGRGIFGSDFGSVSFTFIKRGGEKRDGIYRRLFKEHVQVRSVGKIKNIFLNREYGYFKTNQNDFGKIAGNPIGYWLSNNAIKAFTHFKPLSKISETRKGLATSDNNRFLRLWHEIIQEQFCYPLSKDKNKKWFPYKKGGARRNWYGNNEYVINWKNNGYEIKNFRDSKGKLRSRPQNLEYSFKQAVTWSKITSGKFSSRICFGGFLFDDASAICHSKDSNLLLKINSFLNTIVAQNLLNAINPTVNIQIGDIGGLPVYTKEVEKNCKECIEISKYDWDCRETSWDFHKNELLNYKQQDLKTTYQTYCQHWKTQFHQLHQNEEELNRQFIKIYGLEDELTPDVPLEDITILRQETSIVNGVLVFHADEVMAQFISYAVGCMFGRYSLDKEGLILANQGETLSDYFEKIEQGKETCSFVPDDDAIIPILEDTWFEDDIVGQFYAFLKASFGEEHFQENLTFLEEQIGMPIRKYFVKSFYKDHIKRYKKRPIYWLFASPQESFRVLIYLHRYTPDTLSHILNNYLREYINKLQTQKLHYEQIEISGTTAEKNKAIKAKDKVEKMILDCETYERDILFPLATERIEIDLDDGVLVNYNKFGRAVKEVKGLNDKKAKAKVRGFDWIDTSQIRD